MPTALQALDLVRDIEERGWVMDSPAGVTGYSGRKVVNVLQHLAQSCPVESCYAEVGVFQGLTLLSVAAVNPALPCFGVDNFAFWDGAGNRRLVEAARDANGLANVHLVAQGYEDALASGVTDGRKIGLYFIDGPHDYRSQLMCLLLALPHLANDAVIVIDDCNYPHVRLATHDFLTAHPEFALLFEAYTPAHPNHMAPATLAAARAGWWNGVHVLARDPQGLLQRRLPQLPSNVRDFQMAGHMLHAARIMPAAEEIFRFADALWMPGRWKSLARETLSLRRRMRALRSAAKSQPPQLNTYSAGLPAAAFAEPSGV